MYDEIPKPRIMADRSKVTIDDLRMEPAQNGVILTWSEKTVAPATKGNVYDNCSWSTKRMVFDFEEGVKDAEESAIDKAMGKYKELWMRQYEEMKK